MRYKATYRKDNPLAVFEGFIDGKITRSELGHMTGDFTTYSGAHFGAVPAEHLQIHGIMTSEEARLIADKIAKGS
jgi:hypothetical protein